MAGVTTTVDLGAPLQQPEIRDRINKGEIVGSRMLVSGPWIAHLRRGARRRDAGGLRRSQHLPPQEAAQRPRSSPPPASIDIKAHAGLTFDDYKAIVEIAHKHRH